MQTYILNVVGCERRSIHIVCAVTIVSFSQTALSAVLRFASGWVRLTGKQSTMKDSGVDGFTYVL